VLGRILALISLLSAAVILLFVGVTLAELKLSPQPIVAQAINAVKDWHRNGLAYLGIKPVRHLNPLRFEETGMVTADVERASPGVTLITGLFGDELRAKLFDLDGTLLHDWPVDLFSVIEDRMRYPFHGNIHGSWLFPNGDLILNLTGHGLVRIDACGRVIWKNFRGTHHSVFVDEQGVLWSPKRARYSIPEISPGQIVFDQIARFDADTGKLLEPIVEARLEGIVMANRIIPNDMVHLNDVELLTKEAADGFPQFEAGDILVNARNFNQLWVLDGETRELKWRMVGPMHSSHDPDFQPDGTITMLDNRPGGPPSAANHQLGRMGGSRILSIDPASREHHDLFSSTEDVSFYTAFRGKHQVLDNGNILITETDAGRVFEVTPAGTIVWSYVNQWDEDEAAWLSEGTRYPGHYRTIGDRVCPE
jgi:hypothetical protein